MPQLPQVPRQRRMVLEALPQVQERNVVPSFVCEGHGPVLLLLWLSEVHEQRRLDIAPPVPPRTRDVGMGTVKGSLARFKEWRHSDGHFQFQLGPQRHPGTERQQRCQVGRLH